MNTVSDVAAITFMILVIVLLILLDQAKKKLLDLDLKLKQARRYPQLVWFEAKMPGGAPISCIIHLDDLDEVLKSAVHFEESFLDSISIRKLNSGNDGFLWANKVDGTGSSVIYHWLPEEIIWEKTE